jgi:dihydroorotase
MIKRKIVISKGRVIDPKNKADSVRDILIEDGKIVPFDSQAAEGAEIIDAANLWVVPGLIDMHVHLRDPGQLHKETIATGTHAAAAGGFTTVCCMPNTSPVIDNAETVEYIKGQASAIRVLPVGSITKGLDGEEISALREMKEAGICAISDDGKTVANPVLFKEAMLRAKALGLPVLVHCEPEESIIERDILLAREADVPLHICHVSTRRGVELIRAARESGQAVTAEAAPHHFTLTRDDNKSDTNFKMSPPLRSGDDRSAIISALKDGVIGVIATDHAPHSEDEKNCDYELAPNGITGLETAFSLAYSELVKTGVLTPLQLIEKFTVNPAEILGSDLGHLSINAEADITIIDPNETYIINKNDSKSKSRNTPFHGREVSGRVVYTIFGGRIIYAYRPFDC